MLIGRVRGAAVLNDHHRIVAIVPSRTVACTHRLGRNAGAEDALDAVGPQKRFKVGRIEGAHAMLGNEPIPVLGASLAWISVPRVPSLKRLLAFAGANTGEAAGHSAYEEEKPTRT